MTIFVSLLFFSDALKGRMSEDDFKEMKRRNAENAQYDQRCASHDLVVVIIGT
jgi:hypothetical protein